MKTSFIASLLLCLVMVTTSFAKEPVRSIDGLVTKVVDGDTIHVTDSRGTKVKVRFYGIDCPETEKVNKRTGKVSKQGQPYGEEAFQALRGKLQRQRVRLDVMDTDRYGRTVSIVWMGNRNINLEMVEDGWAWAYTQYLDRPHASEYIQAEEQARKEHKGFMAAKQTSAALGVQKTAETPTLTEMIASFDPDRHGGEVMVTEPVGAEEG